jgi:hypothetical protein
MKMQDACVTLGRRQYKHFRRVGLIAGAALLAAMLIGLKLSTLLSGGGDGGLNYIGLTQGLILVGPLSLAGAFVILDSSWGDKLGIYARARMHTVAYWILLMSYMLPLALLLLYYLAYGFCQVMEALGGILA